MPLYASPAPLPRRDRESRRDKEERRLVERMRKLDEMGVVWSVGQTNGRRTVRFNYVIPNVGSMGGTVEVGSDLYRALGQILGHVERFHNWNKWDR